FDFVVGPAVASISPTSGPANTSVIVNGTGFGGTPGFVYFNNTAGTVTNWTSTQIQVTVPPSATTGPVKVRANNVDRNSDLVSTMVTPTVLSVVPSSGPVGTPVQVNGSGFGASPATLKFAGVNAPIGTWSDTQITTTVPTGATTGAVVATVAQVSGN